MKRKVHTLYDLDDIAVDLVKSLQPKGLTVGDLRKVFQIAINCLDDITYGEPVFEAESDDTEAD